MEGNVQIMFLCFLGMPFHFNMSYSFIARSQAQTAIEITCRLALKLEFESNRGELWEKTIIKATLHIHVNLASRNEHQ